MLYMRKDKGCEARILAFNPDTDILLIEATWPPKNRNIVNVSADYFEQKYGVNPRG